MSRCGSTLCWDCKNAVLGCSWSRDFVPVEGWKAVPTKVYGGEERVTDSFNVLECPEFVPDERCEK